jgi:hypothetical protein
MIIPLKAMDARKYHAQKYTSFSCLHMFGVEATFSAVHVSWKKSTGIKLRDIGDTATVYANRGGSAK